ncbi:hypothetical protein [Streptomyces sp. Ag109_O5-10]|uniref:hypothetical protein n=1 Tax=Streptomyces sp. Ag109_O5-10 TaxID=1855349 RepID=UPI000B89755A|nr:hypothetical protein [Streptomyces sp. Ag109_O5-10]
MGAMEPRSAAAAGKDFPYTLDTTCYIEVHEDGRVTQGAGPDAYQRAVAGESRLFAVWPGQWRSDLFVIDDLDEFARAHGIVHDKERTGLADHVHDVHWSLADREQNPRSQYVSIDLRLACGCSVKDRRTFAAQMREQRGWDLAVSGGWGYHTDANGTTYTFRARRKSLSS